MSSTLPNLCRLLSCSSSLMRCNLNGQSGTRLSTSPCAAMWPQLARSCDKRHCRPWERQAGCRRLDTPVRDLCYRLSQKLFVKGPVLSCLWDHWDLCRATGRDDCPRESEDSGSSIAWAPHSESETSGQGPLILLGGAAKRGQVQRRTEEGSAVLYGLVATSPLAHRHAFNCCVVIGQLSISVLRRWVYAVGMTGGLLRPGCWEGHSVLSAYTCELNNLLATYMQQGNIVRG